LGQDFAMLFGSKKLEIPSPEESLPGRVEKMPVRGQHAVLKTSTVAPYGRVDGDGAADDEGHLEELIVGMGCFWGVERMFWGAPGVRTTAVGYSAGSTPNPTYEEVCGGGTGHNEVVLIVFDTRETSLEKMLAIFWEGHDPTQGMRQGNDRGTQYRSGIYVFNDEQLAAAKATRNRYQGALNQAGRGEITSEILPAAEFYYAEDYHQQYLAKNPQGYYGVGGIGVALPES
jgi:peptide-methionine (S)-S-oxide reductase